MSLSDTVLAFVTRAAKDPSYAANLTNLSILQQLAAREVDSYRQAAITLPIAPDTAEIPVFLPGTGGIGAANIYSWTGPVEIVGMVPTLSVNTASPGPGLRVPTLDDVLVELVWCDSLKEQTRQGPQVTGFASPQGSRDGYVTASVLSTNSRNFRRVLDRANPNVTVTARYKVTGNVFFDSLFSVALFVRTVTA